MGNYYKTNPFCVHQEDNPFHDVVVCVSLHYIIHVSKHEYNAMAPFQVTTNVGNKRDKYCLLSFKHGNKMGLLTPFAKINKRECLNKVQGGGKKYKNINAIPLVLSTQEYLLNKRFRF